MTAAVIPKSTRESQYGILRADFESAYREMKAASTDYTAVLMSVSVPLSPDERRARKEAAAQVYEEAHEKFMAVVRTLHQFLIDQIVESHSVFPPALIQR